VRHGAKVKRCSCEGCTSYAQSGGVCMRHGATVKLCSQEGCAKQAKNGGVCLMHGAQKKAKLCNSYHFFSPSNNKDEVVLTGKEEGANPSSPLWVPPICLSLASMGTRAAAAATTASVSATNARDKTLNTPKRLREEQQQEMEETVRKRSREACSADRCTTKFVRSGGLLRHWATLKRCNHEGCTNHALKGGVCFKHGTQCEGQAVQD
jgi:hypothetical protein